MGKSIGRANTCRAPCVRRSTLAPEPYDVWVADSSITSGPSMIGMTAAPIERLWSWRYEARQTAEPVLRH